jgi:hypothetical protein
VPTGSAHAPGCYWVNRSTGTIQRQCNPLLAFALGQAGFDGCNDMPAGLGGTPCPTFEAAKAYAQQTGHHPGQIPSPANPLKGVAAVGDFFSRLTESSTWIRIGEFIGGGILVIVGLNALARGTPVGNAVQSVKTGAKKAVKTGAVLAK